MPYVYCFIFILKSRKLMTWQQRDWVSWFFIRAYSLYALVILDSFLPWVSEYLYPSFMLPHNRLLWHGSVLDMMWVVCNGCLVLFLLFQRFRQVHAYVRATHATSENR